MKTIFTLSGLLLMMLIAFPSFAQDQIHKRNKEIIDCKIREVGSEEIKYILPEFPPDVLFSLEKEKIEKIVFSNGKELTFQKEMTNPENYMDNFKNALKVDFLSPLTGNLTLYYERSLKPGRSFEVSLGIIGLGRDVADEDPFGAFVKIGPKFIKSPDFYLKGMRYAHILKGGYVKPELVFGYFKKDDWDYWDGSSYSYPREERIDIITGALLVTLGKQWVIDNAFLIDFYFGIGYGFSSNNDYESYYYSHAGPDGDSPLAFSAGLKIGGLFK